MKPGARRRSRHATHSRTVPGRRSCAVPRPALIVLAVLASAAVLDVQPAAAQGREIELVGQIRVRPELRDNADFDSTLPDRERFFGQRTRLGIDARLNPKVMGRVVVQDTRYWGVESATTDTGSDRQSLDLLEGYVDLRWIWDLPLDFRIGRQPFQYGSERLVGNDDWSNTSRVFDAYKFHFGLGAFFLDLYSSKLVDTNPPGGTGRSEQDINFSGIYFSKEGDRLELIDLYWLRYDDRTDPAAGRYRRSMLGVLGRYQLIRDLGLEIEYAYQTGDSAAVDIQAQMLAAELGWRSRGARDSRVVLGFDWATGDADGLADNTIRTFSQFFPSGHEFLGNMDYAGRQNIQDFWGRVSTNVSKSLSGLVAVHFLRLDKSQDAWYVASGEINGTSADGSSRFGPDPSRAARNLGWEVDLELGFDFAEGSTVEVGYSHFAPGDVVRHRPQTPGGTPGPVPQADGSDFVYLTIALDL